MAAGWGRGAGRGNDGARTDSEIHMGLEVNDRRGFRGWALRLVPTPGTERHHSRYTIQ